MRENFVQALTIVSKPIKRNKEEKQRDKSNMKQLRMALQILRMLCQIQKDSSSKTNLEHFLESIVYILYIFSKLGKSRVQRFKWCANRSWNEEVMTIWRQLHQAKNEFRSTKSKCEIFAPAEVKCENFATPNPNAKFSQLHI